MTTSLAPMLALIAVVAQSGAPQLPADLIVGVLTAATASGGGAIWLMRSWMRSQMAELERRRQEEIADLKQQIISQGVELRDVNAEYIRDTLKRIERQQQEIFIRLDAIRDSTVRQDAQIASLERLTTTHDSELTKLREQIRATC